MSAQREQIRTGSGSDRLKGPPVSTDNVSDSVASNSCAFQAFKSAVTRCLQDARDPRLNEPVRVTQLALTHAETWLAQT
ncbi:MAG: hypothetical protein M3R52_10670, partial [Acidobacteriota bacterium]|nr:hypothetical protein [Acidobacteriota bacterium]